MHIHQTTKRKGRKPQTGKEAELPLAAMQSLCNAGNTHYHSTRCGNSTLQYTYTRTHHARLCVRLKTVTHVTDTCKQSHNIHQNVEEPDLKAACREIVALPLWDCSSCQFVHKARLDHGTHLTLAGAGRRKLGEARVQQQRAHAEARTEGRPSQAGQQRTCLLGAGLVAKQGTPSPASLIRPKLPMGCTRAKAESRPGQTELQCLCGPSLVTAQAGPGCSNRWHI